MSDTPAAPHDEFESARDRLYREFASVDFDPHMERCAHCVSPADVAALGGEVRTLDPAIVARFVAKAGTTWGGPDDLRRVAPRALSLSADAALPIHRSVLLDKLVTTGWSAWPAPQVDAVCRFLLAEWTRLLSSPPRAGHAAHQWLRQTARATADIGPFLARWQAAMDAQVAAPRRRSATVHLAVLLVKSDFRPDFPGSIALLFDHDRVGTGGPSDQLAAWLTSTVTGSQLSHAAAALAGTSDSRRVDLAVERLRRYHAAVARSDVHAG